MISSEAVRRRRFLLLALLAMLTTALVVAALVRSRPNEQAVATPTPGVSTPASTTTEDATPTPSTLALTAVFLGDRYTEDAAWPQLLGDAKGWQVENLAQAGMGYRVAPNSCETSPCTPFRGMVSRVAALDPDVVVFAGGEADGDYELAPFVAATLDAFRQELPDAQIVVLSPLSAQAPQPYFLRLHAQTLREAAADAGAVYVDASRVVGNASSYAKGALTPDANSALASLVAAGLP